MTYKVSFEVQDGESFLDALTRLFGIVTVKCDPAPEPKTRKPRTTTRLEPKQDVAAEESLNALGSSANDTLANLATLAPAPEPEPVVVTKADVMRSLQAVMNGPGVESALKLLGEFNAQNISTLKVEDYPVFVKRAGEFATKQGATLAS